MNYKRINHFHELLDEKINRKISDVPDQVLNDIESENLSNKEFMSSKTKIRELLKKFGHQRYYEYDQVILDHFVGIPPIQISQEVKENLYSMFEQVSDSFDKNRSKFYPRISFLSYNYVCHKLCQLKEYHEPKELFPLMKSRDKLIQTDKIWKEICEDLNWTFIPSV